MININDIKRVYFIGIGGIGMSAIARYFKSLGKNVSGYDRTETVLTKKLVEEGIAVHYADDVNLAPMDADIVVYTPAIPATHKELNHYKANNYPILKRSDVLGIITDGSFNICVAGTHGKTTISSMVAHLLRDTGYGCNAFLGGIAANYNSNYWSHERNVCVVEADEYDRSFLKLHPDIAVISAMDADHLDIYGTEEVMQDAFVEFTGKIKPNGVLLYKSGLDRADSFRAPKSASYHFNDANADAYAQNVRTTEGSYHFDIVTPKGIVSDLTLHMGGLHNIENMVVAVTIANELEINHDLIRNAVESYKGVKRRFEYIVKEKAETGPVFIDDYAHHPEELRALIDGARKLFPDLKCTVIFQPHLFTRTRDLSEGFAKSLDMADEVVILPIYPARELPIEGVSSDLIFNKMKNRNKHLVDKEGLVNFVEGLVKYGANGHLIITAGAGDIDTKVLQIKELIEKADK
ncbi:MAG: UDP-N-acetylmuramate--L-alanine ligase [Flavitalea sp.]